MKRNILGRRVSIRVLLGLLSLNLHLVASDSTQPPDFAWATRIGGANYDHSGTVAVDRQGNVFVVGILVAPASFGTQALMDSPGAHFFVAKYEPGGNLVWVRSTESGLFWTGNPMAFDSVGNAYIAGRFKGTVQMGGLTLVGSTNTGNIFLLKLDPAGLVAWGKGVRTGDVDSYPRLAVDGADQVILAGTFQDHVSFGTNRLTSAGDYDLFVAKFDGNGQSLWARQGAGPDYKGTHAVVTDANNNVWVSGNFSTRIDFGLGPLTGPTGIDEADYFLVKYDAAGNPCCVRQVPGTDCDDFISRLAVDPVGGVFMAAQFWDSTILGTNTFASRGGTDVLLAQFTPDGSVSWARQAGGPENDVVSGLVVDRAGRIYLAGDFSGTAAWGANVLVSRGSSDFFLAKYDSAGQVQWVGQGGGLGWDYQPQVALDVAGNIYLTGLFFDSVSFGAFTLTTRGLVDVFMVNYNPSGDVLWAQSAGGPDYDYPGDNDPVDSGWAVDRLGNIYVSGTFKGDIFFGTNRLTSAGFSDIYLAKLPSTLTPPFPPTPGTAPQPFHQWTRRPPTSSWYDDWPNAAVVDRAGNFCVTGTEMGSNYLDFDYRTIQYSPTGQLLWSARYDGPGHFYDFANALAVDDAGHVYVTGQSVGVSNEYDIATIKYDSNGQALWVARFDGPTHERDRGFGVHVDGSGHVYVGGDSGWFRQSCFLMLKYDAAGHGLWTNYYRVPGYAWHHLSAMVVDSAGNSYLAGETQSESASFFLTVKFDVNGQLAWAATHGGQTGQGGWASSLAADEAGNVYVTGTTTEGDEDWAFTTIKYDSSGARQWVATYKGPEPGYHWAVKIQLDGAGHLYVAGGLPGRWVPGEGYLYDIATLKYDTDGRLLWAARHHGEGTQSEWNADLALDASGRACVAATAWTSNTLNDIALIKYDLNGNLLWLTRYNGPANQDEWKPHLALDQAGGVYLATASGDANTRLDWAVVKYAESNVSGLPYIIAQPQGQTVEWGTPVTFSVSAGGSNLSYQWRWNGQPIPGATNSTLALGNVVSGAMGDYSVEVRNGVGWTASPEARLVVYRPPTVEIYPLFQRVLVGATFALDAHARGTGPLELQWFSNGSPIPDATNGVLQFENAQLDQSGCYFARVQSPYGSATSEVACVEVVGSKDNPGALDLSFVAGLGAWGGARALAQQGDGKLLVGGVFSAVDPSGSGRTSLARLLPDGELDPTFNPVLEGPYEETPTVNSILVLPDHTVVIGGYFNRVNGLARHNLARLNPDGTLGSGFELTEGVLGEVRVLARQPDGRVLVAGHRGEPGANDGAGVVLRFTAEGSRETAYQVETSGGYGIAALVVQPDNKVLIAGSFEGVNGLGTGSLIRLLPDGSIDPDFATWFGPAAWSALALQADGQVLAGGWVDDAEEDRYLRRFHPDGTEDTGFAPQLSSPPDVILVQPDGRILIGGGFFVVNGVFRAGVARLNPDGTLDYEFDPWGGVGEDGAVAAMLIQSNEGLLIGGSFSSFDGVPRRGLARLKNDMNRIVVVRQLPYDPEDQRTVRLVATPVAGAAVYAVQDQPPAGWQISHISHGGVFDPATGRVKFGPFYDADPRTLSYRVLWPPWGVYGVAGVFTFVGEASADGINTPITGDPSITLAGMHPVDISPADRRVNIAEMTAYGAAWRRGQTWAIPPVPIPIDYVTRAAALWRGGECYTVDASVTIEPLWWVNCDPPSRADLSSQGVTAATQTFNLASAASYTPGAQQARPAGLRYERAVAREAPATYVPGQAVSVRIRVSPEGATHAYAMEELTPAGWVIAGISDGGEFDAVSGKVRWGPFVDGVPRTFTYAATAPPTADGLADFRGVGSFDGVSAGVSGTGQLVPTCRVSVEPGEGGAGLRLRLAGVMGAVYVLEASGDLVQWTPLATLTNTTGRLEFRDPAAGNFSHRFYRAIYDH